MKNVLYIATLAAFLYSCKPEVPKEKTTTDGLITVTSTQFQSLQMEMGTPGEHDFEVTVKAAGNIDVPPQYRAKVATFLGGYVKATKLLVGDRVTKGQPLITLENTEYLDLQKEYLVVAEQINYLKSEFERQKTLYAEKITSQKNYLKAESNYRQAKGMYQGLRAKLLLLNINPANVEQGKFTSQITIAAPISGDVTVMNANAGMFMSPSDVIMEIVDTDFLHLNLSIFEKDILHVKQGQDITFKVPEASDEIYSSKVQVVGKSIESKDRTISVFGTLSPAIRAKLLSGMFVEATIVTKSKKGLGIPADAVVTENNRNYVLLLKSSNDGYKFKKTAVSIGAKSGAFVEIIPDSAVNEGTKILTKGIFDIVE